MLFGDYGISYLGQNTGLTTDVLIAVQDFTDPTATGNQDYTTTALNGKTPVGAMVMSTWHRSASDPSETINARFALGAMDGTTQTSAWLNSRDNRANTSSSTYQRSDQVHLQVDAGATNTVQRATGSFITDGIRLNYTNIVTNVGAVRGSFVAFAGADVTVDHGNISLGTGTSAINVTTGFQPDVVIFYGTGISNQNSIPSDMRYMLGIALADGTQKCVIWAEPTGAADGRPYQTLYTNRCGGRLTPATGALTWHLTAGGFNASGFQVTPSASASSSRLHYLALKLNGRRLSLFEFDTPTSTGSQSYTTPGFTPQFAMAVTTNLEVVDTVVGSTSDNQGGFGVAFIGNEQWAASARIDSGAPTTDTGCRLQNYALLGASATSTIAIAATLTGFTSAGLELNYSAVQAAAKKGFMLCIE
jgi:hypothetical protein